MQPVDEGNDWDLKSYCDSDWAGDAETRIRVTGFIIICLECPFVGGQRGRPFLATRRNMWPFLIQLRKCAIFTIC
jgi:hypothetical protein